MEKSISINYMVLRYIPDDIRQENIIVGLAFHSPQKKESFFKSTISYKRLKAFDDEMDKELYDADMNSFHEAFDFPFYKGGLETFGYFDFNDIENENFLYNRNIDYSNEYRFDDVISIQSNDKDYYSEIESITDIYLHYDKPKSKRFDNRLLKSTLSKILRSRVPNNRLNVNINKYKDPFSNKKTFDYEFENTFYRVLSFDYANSGDLIKQIRSALFSIYDIKFNKSNVTEPKVVFVINDDYDKNKETHDLFSKYITNIFLNEDISIMKISDFINSVKA